MGSPTNPVVDKFGRAIAKVDYSPAGPANEISFGLSKVGPPSPLYIQRDDVLRVRCWNSSATGTLGLSYRLLSAHDGKISNAFINLIPTTNRAAVDFNIPLAEGYLLSVVVGNNQGAAPNRGEQFCDVAILRNVASAPFFAQLLVSDYITGFSPIGWPGGMLRSSLEGPGVLQSIAVTQPAAGADWVQTVPTGARWRVVSTHATLTTAVAVANRVPELLADDGANNLFRGTPNQVVAASLAPAVSGGTVVTPAAANIADVMVSVPEQLILKQAWRFKSNTLNLQAADQWSNVRLLVEEWIDTLN